MILGSNGFIGKNLVRYILTNDLMNEFSFILVGRKQTEEKIDGITYRFADLTNYNLLESLLVSTAPNYIINLAGIIDSDLDACIQLNAELPRKILEIIISNKLSIDKVLLIGSAAEYGGNSSVPLTEPDDLRPLSPYGLSKLIQTEYFRYYAPKIKVNLARTFNIIGPFISNKLSIGSFIEKINQCGDYDFIYTGNLSSKRDYLYVDDVISAFLSILISGRPGEIYNVCSGEAISMHHIVSSLIRVSGKTIEVKIDPGLVREIDIPISYGNNQKIIDHTGWSPKIRTEEMYSKLF